MKRMIIVLSFMAASMLFGCSEQEVVPASEVATVESQADYHETPEGGITDREGPLEW